MKYKAEIKISNQVLTQQIIKDEDLFRDVAFKIIKELPINKIKQLFNLKLIKGIESELEKAYRENDAEKIDKIHILLEENTSLFVGEIDIP